MPLYPPIPPRQQYHLPVDTLHSLYVEECGNPAGRPVVVLHGGPGGSCSPHLRRFFDPQYWRIILFDQRGAGRSTPSACLTDNSTDDLIADMERLRQHLQIDRWMLFGGSWGATLALRYASEYPQRVSAMVLRGIFLCRQQDLAWLYYPGGAGRVRPEAWAEFIAPIPGIVFWLRPRVHSSKSWRVSGRAGRQPAQPFCRPSRLLMASLVKHWRWR